MPRAEQLESLANQFMEPIRTEALSTSIPEPGEIDAVFVAATALIRSGRHTVPEVRQALKIAEDRYFIIGVEIPHDK